MTMPSDDHVSKCGAMSAQRVEVFTGAGRRREWRDERRAAIIAESYAGTLSVCDVARRHGLTPSQLFTWRRNARRRGASSGDEQNVSFVRAVVADEVDAATMGKAGEIASKSAPVLELEIGGSSVWVWREAEADLVTAVIRVLKGAR